MDLHHHMNEVPMKDWMVAIRTEWGGMPLVGRVGARTHAEAIAYFAARFGIDWYDIHDASVVNLQ